GTPGENAYCSVYKNRPSTCREFAMSGENGIANEACNRAREKYGFPKI
ncbi:YkgJ family cysteine cluster protein, partial [Escherichia coli]